MDESNTLSKTDIALVGDPAERRRSVRIARPRRAQLWTLDGEDLCEADVINMSTGGAKLKADRELALPARFLVAMNRYEGQDIPRVRCALQWQRAEHFGLSFY